MTSERPEWFNILNTVTVEQILDMERDLVTVEMSHTAEEVLNVISKNHVHGALINDDEGNPTGFADVYDVLSYLVFCLAGGTDDVPTDKLAQFESGDFGDAEHMYGRNFAGSLVDISGKDQFETIAKDAMLTEAVKKLTTHHRLAVVDGDNKVVNVISQSDIITFLTQCGHWVWEAAETHVGQLISAADESNLVTVTGQDSVVKALLQMYEKKVIAAAVIDENGTMVANFSASDLVTIKRTNMAMLAMPVLEFLKAVHPALKPAVTIDQEANLELVFLKLSVYKIHRVWIINENTHPTGVLTLTDLMKYLNRYDLFL